MVAPTLATADNWTEFSERCLFPLVRGEMPDVGGLTAISGDSQKPSASPIFQNTTTFSDDVGEFQISVSRDNEPPGVYCRFFSVQGAEFDVKAYEDWLAAQVANGTFFEDEIASSPKGYNARINDLRLRVWGVYGEHDGLFRALFSVSQYREG